MAEEKNKEEVPVEESKEPEAKEEVTVKQRKEP